MIDSRELYDYAKGRGYEPLTDARLPMAVDLRKEIQTDLFGKGHSPAENGRFYRWCWARMPHRCEECRRPLEGYSAVYISHILSRGAEPEMAHDPRNVNILCFDCHNKWEHATTRKGMRIYDSNRRKIALLKAEYRKNV